VSINDLPRRNRSLNNANFVTPPGGAPVSPVVSPERRLKQLQMLSRNEVFSENSDEESDGEELELWSTDEEEEEEWVNGDEWAMDDASTEEYDINMMQRAEE
jgi:hypothetical protein